MGDEQLKAGSFAGERTCWRKSSSTVEMIAASMYSPKFVNEALIVLGKQLIDDGRLDSVSQYSAGPTADFPELDTLEWQEDDYDQQGNLLDPIKVKKDRRNRVVLKQKLFDYVPQSECAERQGRPYSLKWVFEKQGRKGQISIGRERDQEGQV